MHHEIVVLGMSSAWSGPLAIDHAVMADAIDIEPVRAALGRLGLYDRGPIAAGGAQTPGRGAGKAEASHDGRLRGHRHTMLDDFDISPRATPARLSAARSQASSAMRRSMFQAAQSIRGRTAAARSR